MKILWHSNAPHAPSGYGSQTDLNCTLFKHELGHDVTISAFWGLKGAKADWNGIEVWPIEGEGNPYGAFEIGVYAAYLGAGDPSETTVITLMDVWALDPRPLAPLAIGSWVPIDHEPVQPKIRNFFAISGSVPIAMSRFGEQQLRNVDLDPLYVPHGIDTARMRPMPRTDARELIGLPEDAFVVGMVAANQGKIPAPRKAFPQALAAFARFREKHPDAFLYLHTFLDPALNTRNGIDLHALIKELGLEDAVVCTPEMSLRLGVPYEEMAYLFSSFDVLLAPSYGEGFGIPIVEAQAAGTPVIVNDFSSMPELCGAGWKVEGTPFPLYDHGAGFGFWSAPSVDSIVDALTAAYHGAEGMRDDARAFAEGYDVKKVLYEHWVPALAELECRLDEKRQLIRSLTQENLNRAQRRALEKAA